MKQLKQQPKAIQVDVHWDALITQLLNVSPHHSRLTTMGTHKMAKNGGIVSINTSNQNILLDK